LTRIGTSSMTSAKSSFVSRFEPNTR
jgi:hypothetical protein